MTSRQEFEFNPIAGTLCICHAHATHTFGIRVQEHAWRLLLTPKVNHSSLAKLVVLLFLGAGAHGAFM